MIRTTGSVIPARRSTTPGRAARPTAASATPRSCGRCRSRTATPSSSTTTARQSCPAGEAPYSCTSGTRTPRRVASPSPSTAWWHSCGGWTRPGTPRSPSAPTSNSSAADPEPGLARGLLVGDVDPGHAGTRRTDATPGHHGQHGVGVALEDCLHLAVAAVAYRPADAGGLALLLARLPEPHA